MIYLCCRCWWKFKDKVKLLDKDQWLIKNAVCKACGANGGMYKCEKIESEENAERV